MRSKIIKLSSRLPFQFVYSQCW